MSAKHTPGPWFHDTCGHPNPDVRAASGRSVAVTWMVCKSNPKTPESYRRRCEEDRANARLIAAAPELLQALVELEAMAERYRPAGHPTPDAQKKARAAIAKATGAES